MRELQELDAQLIDALRRADIRLLRTEWLRKQPVGFLLPKRQQLEAAEERGELPSPLLHPNEAIILIQRADRSVGVLSHGWLTASHCDPAGARVAVVIATLIKFSYLEGLFWDMASMYQKPRTEQQDEAFGRALKVMGDLYASAVGTSVLQHKEIPSRPACFDGAMRLGDLKRNEAAIRAELGAFGEVVSCDVTGDSALVHFASHGAHCPLFCPFSFTSARSS